MQLKVLLPSHVFLDTEVTKVIAEGKNGQFCLKPRHIDFVSALAPGILVYTDNDEREHFLAVDQGILVKCQHEVTVSTRNALYSDNLDELESVVQKEYMKLSEHEQAARSAVSRMEAGILRSMIELD